MIETVDNLHSIADRLERLERDNRRIRRFAWALFVVVGAVVLMGQTSATPRRYEADSFTLKDKGGRKCAALRIRDDGTPALEFYDKDNNTRAAMYVTDDGSPGLWLFDKSLKARLALTLLPDKGSAGMTLLDAEGRAQMMLSASEGGAWIQMLGNDGKDRVTLASTPSIPAIVGVADRDGTSRGGFIVLANGSPSVVLLDKQHAERINLGLDSDGSPSLKVSDADGKTRATLGASALETIRTGEVTNRPPSSLVLFDKEGKVIWSAP